MRLLVNKHNEFLYALFIVILASFAQHSRYEENDKYTQTELTLHPHIAPFNNLKTERNQYDKQSLGLCNA